ncbi:hypothetical protein ACFQS3_19985 [Glycomyces mayteni]|uniref:Uncharacterized protein n=1 Tax=Glycomyces mayteni TaxID=543887 RepID=A0ABW2DD33_9ACTN
MEAIAQFFLETVFGAATGAARRRRAARFAAAHGLRTGDGAGLDELEALGVRFNKPAAETAAGERGGRRVAAFTNPGVWDGRKHVAYRFTAVSLRGIASDLLVADAGSERFTKQWFDPEARCLAVPVPEGAKRTAVAADPAGASALLGSLADPLGRAWMVRGNWVVGWRRGHAKPDADAALLAFLGAAADAIERP